MLPQTNYLCVVIAGEDLEHDRQDDAGPAQQHGATYTAPGSETFTFTVAAGRAHRVRRQSVIYNPYI